jgi:GNAT superfamily N-acetyltransferase
MAVPLTFRPAIQYERGTVCAILTTCYAEILDALLREKLEQFDRDVSAYPDTVGVCTLISSVDDETAGLVSYDPRQGPEVGILGHNGVLPPYRQQGYGTQQIQEILRRFASRRFARAHVSTSEHPFFAPARRMYERCGFRECDRTPNHDRGPYRIVHYQMRLPQTDDSTSR